MPIWFEQLSHSQRTPELAKGVQLDFVYELKSVITELQDGTENSEDVQKYKIRISGDGARECLISVISQPRALLY